MMRLSLVLGLALVPVGWACAWTGGMTGHMAGHMIAVVFTAAPVAFLTDCR